MADPVIQHVPSTPESLGQKTSAESFPVVLASDQAITLDPQGIATEAKQDTIIGHIDGLETDLAAVKTATARIPGDLLSGISFDYYTVDRSGATTNVWTYKTGGSGGTLVATITVTYTDATKTLIASAAKT
jgi:hypothetical protein